MIDAAKVEAIFRDCQLDPEAPDAVVVVGVRDGDFAFDPERLASHRGAVAAMLRELPAPFQSNNGGGWTFLNACDDLDGREWTDLHERAEQLVVLGLGLGLVTYTMPRELWDALPGGMPYLTIDSKAV